MCGIFGFISHREETYLDRKIFDRFISVLSHRGPDATGTYIGPGFGFSHCRLAIIDLDPRSNQPFVDEETGVVISYRAPANRGDAFSDFPCFRRHSRVFCKSARAL